MDENDNNNNFSYFGIFISILVGGFYLLSVAKVVLPIALVIGIILGGMYVFWVIACKVGPIIDKPIKKKEIRGKTKPLEKKEIKPIIIPLKEAFPEIDTFLLNAYNTAYTESAEFRSLVKYYPESAEKILKKLSDQYLNKANHYTEDITFAIKLFATHERKEIDLDVEHFKKGQSIALEKSNAYSLLRKQNPMLLMQKTISMRYKTNMRKDFTPQLIAEYLVKCTIDILREHYNLTPEQYVEKYKNK